MRSAPGDESAGVGPERHPALGSAGEAAPDELDEEPIAQHDVGRHDDAGDEDGQDDQHVDPHPGIEHDVGAHHPADRAGRAHHGNGARGIHERLRRRRRESAQDVEGEEAEVSHRVLHIVPEDPEEPHVTDEMKPASVEKHGGERGKPGPLATQQQAVCGSHRHRDSLGQAAEELARNESQLANRAREAWLRAHALHQHPHCHIDPDKDQRDDGGC